MRSSPISPKTVSGIKSYARDLKKSLGIDHHAALQMASVAAGYQNLDHAKAATAKLLVKVTAPRHVTVLTGHWKDPETHTKGTECLAIALSRPLLALATHEQMKHHMLLGDSFIYDGQQLVCNALRSGQDSTRFTLCQLARTLQFMDATGLRPSSSRSRIYPGGNVRNRPPGADHTRAWYAPDTGAFYMSDEPYQDEAHLLDQKRSQWAQQHSYAVLQAKWPGMHAPEAGSRLYLIGSNSRLSDMQAMLASIDDLSDAICCDAWAGASLPYGGLIVTPSQVPAPIQAGK